MLCVEQCGQRWCLRSNVDRLCCREVRGVKRERVFQSRQRRNMATVRVVRVSARQQSNHAQRTRTALLHRLAARAVRLRRRFRVAAASFAVSAHHPRPPPLPRHPPAPHHRRRRSHQLRQVRATRRRTALRGRSAAAAVHCLGKWRNLRRPQRSARAARCARRASACARRQRAVAARYSAGRAQTLCSQVGAETERAHALALLSPCRAAARTQPHARLSRGGRLARDIRSAQRHCPRTSNVVSFGRRRRAVSALPQLRRGDAHVRGGARPTRCLSARGRGSPASALALTSLLRRRKPRASCGADATRAAAGRVLRRD